MRIEAHDVNDLSTNTPKTAPLIQCLLTLGACAGKYTAKELWTNATMAVHAGGSLSFEVAANGVAVFRLEKAQD